MLKFAAGAIVGWIAARSVPSAPLAPPTLDELVLLAQKGKVYYDKAVQKLQEQESHDKD
jgi:hypothetical protein|tara:strand:+ start:1584 stop:1760 length:177 start_codon:yes stop_codon:yes gene_type:complete